jgi:hypothetical protein
MRVLAKVLELGIRWEAQADPMRIKLKVKSSSCGIMMV